ncbi:hypothetical protein LTR28_004126, partial [Elasticomyces elasticus]
MASTPVLTFKAGKCMMEGKSVKPDPTPGYIYLYQEDDLFHFCWRPRSAPSTEPELDLIMFPGDASFTPLLTSETAPHNASDHRNPQKFFSPINGRIYKLKFNSSSQKHFFWMQSKSQHVDGNVSWFSARDLALGKTVNQLLQGEDVDVDAVTERLREENGGGGGGRDDDGDDDAMEDVQGSHVPEQGGQGSTGGAGADATGGDPTEEGEASRQGGADGGRAPSDTNTIIQNFLNSLKSGPASRNQQRQTTDNPSTTLPELLPSSTTIPTIDAAPAATIDTLCAHLPPTIFLLAQEANDLSSSEPSAAT